MSDTAGGQPVGEQATLADYLDHYRSALERKCAGLDAEQLARRSVPPSTLSLLGLVRHLAQVENHWFVRVLQADTSRPRLFKRPDDNDWDFHGAVGEPAVVAEAFGAWRAEVEAGRRWLEAYDETLLGATVALADQQASVRDILVHVIEEYARHLGHADLLRECIDGATGE